MIHIDWINVYPKKISLIEGDVYYIQQILFCPRYAPSREVILSSNNTDVATVDSSKQCIFAKSVGEAEICISSAIDFSAKDCITVTVTQKPIPKSYVKLDTKILYLQKGEKATVAANVRPKGLANNSINWSSSNTDVATVKDGIITAKSSGYASIRAIPADNYDSRDYCDVFVTEDILVKTVNITPKYKTMKISDYNCIYKYIYPANATNTDVEWISSNSDIIEIDSKNGIIIAKNIGSATITAIALDGSKKSDTCTITVTI